LHDRVVPVNADVGPQKGEVFIKMEIADTGSKALSEYADQGASHESSHFVCRESR